MADVASFINNIIMDPLSLVVVPWNDNRITEAIFSILDIVVGWIPALLQFVLAQFQAANFATILSNCMFLAKRTTFVLIAKILSVINILAYNEPLPQSGFIGSIFNIVRKIDDFLEQAMVPILCFYLDIVDFFATIVSFVTGGGASASDIVRPLGAFFRRIGEMFKALWTQGLSVMWKLLLQIIGGANSGLGFVFVSVCEVIKVVAWIIGQAINLINGVCDISIPLVGTLCDGLSNPLADISDMSCSGRRLAGINGTSAADFDPDTFQFVMNTMDWSGSTLCANIGRSRTMPTTPFEIAIWKDCVQKRLELLAIAAVVRLPQNIFDDWPTGAWFMIRLVPATVMRTFGYSMQFIDQQTGAGTGVAADDLVRFATTLVKQVNFTALVGNGPLAKALAVVPALTMPNKTEAAHFVQHATHLYKHIQINTPVTHGRRLTESNVTAKNTDILEPTNRWKRLWIFKEASDPRIKHCNIVTELVGDMGKLAVAIFKHYTVTLPETFKQWLYWMKNTDIPEDRMVFYQRKDLIPAEAYEIEDPVATKTLGTITLKDTSLGKEIKLFLTGTRDDTSQLFTYTLAGWMHKAIQTCKYADVIAHKCKQPFHSIADSLNAVVYAAGGIFVFNNVIGIPVPIVIAWPIYIGTWFYYRYEYVPKCSGLLPMCTVRDMQLVQKHLLEDCFCKTHLGKGLVHEDTMCDCENDVKYITCPQKQLSILVWPQLQLIAWNFPTAFKFVMELPDTQLPPDIQRMIEYGDKPPDIDKSCAILHSTTGIAIVLALPLVVSIAGNALAFVFNLAQQTLVLILVSS